MNSSFVFLFQICNSKDSVDIYIYIYANCIICLSVFYPERDVAPL